MADTSEHIQVPDELLKLGGNPGLWGDALQVASVACRKKLVEESRAGGLAWASCGMKGWRETMEDASLVMPVGYMGGSFRDTALFGVFDGHGGEQVARFAARRLPSILAELPARSPGDSMSTAYQRIDGLLRMPSIGSELRELTIPGNMQRESAETCGTTAVCCMVRGSELVIANAGDSRAVLCRQGKAFLATADHKPNVPSELARIEEAGGFIEEQVIWGGRGTDYRVNGEINLSRALGDLRYKDDGLSVEKQIVSCVPDISTVTWEAGRDEFVLLACDGVWDTMGSQEAVDFVRRRLPPPGPNQKLAPVLEALADACCANHPKQWGGMGCDNITAVLVRFEDPEALVAAPDAVGEPTDDRLGGFSRRQLETALSQTIQKLRRKETDEERAIRLKQEREDREEAEAREREWLEQQKRSKERREQREKTEALTRKRSRCCAALDDDQDEEDDFSE